MDKDEKAWTSFFLFKNMVNGVEDPLHNITYTITVTSM